jgi:hypothetical protein
MGMAMFCKFYRYSCSSTKYALGICEYFSLVFVIAKVEMKRKIGLVFYPFDICILLFFVAFNTRMALFNVLVGTLVMFSFLKLQFVHIALYCGYWWCLCGVYFSLFKKILT